MSKLGSLARCSREALHPEVSELTHSIYEFIQRRADWKKIEKTVDKVRCSFT